MGEDATIQNAVRTTKEDSSAAEHSAAQAAVSAASAAISASQAAASASQAATAATAAVLQIAERLSTIERGVSDINDLLFPKNFNPEKPGLIQTIINVQTQVAQARGILKTLASLVTALALLVVAALLKKLI